MNTQTIQNFPNISAETVKKFLEKKGYKIDFDFRNARLGGFHRGLVNCTMKDRYKVLIACCSDSSHTWICIATDSIPQGTRYILECQPRENTVNLWHLNHS